ncbi:hypothetical protein F5Y17DRAFT_458613 [Xylariaceae sp. FL0594]|nr:hypothetical protein F5Y17DRAFT_458613 [Xylariaceae sp. FL0594]
MSPEKRKVGAGSSPVDESLHQRARPLGEDPSPITVSLERHSDSGSNRAVTELTLDPSREVFQHHCFHWCPFHLDVQVLTIASYLTSEERATVVEKFNDPKSNVEVLVCSTRTAGAGIDLHLCCCRGFVVSLGWSANALNQILGRLVRIGQRRFVEWEILSTAGTIYEKHEQIMWGKYAQQIAADAQFDSRITGELGLIVCYEVIRTLYYQSVTSMDDEMWEAQCYIKKRNHWCLLRLSLDQSDMLPVMLSKLVRMQTTNRKGDEEEVGLDAGTEHWRAIVAERYGTKCILTGRNTVEASQILADAITGNKKTVEKFTQKLHIFWPTEKVDRFSELVNQSEHIAENLLVLSRCAHKDWAKAKFALRPHSMTATRLTLEFVWLTPSSHPGGILYSRDTEDTDRLINQGPSASTSEPYAIQTGDRVVLETSDASQFPLPSWLLLQLQWDLHSVVRACGQADILAAIFPQEPDQYGLAVSNDVDGGKASDVDGGEVSGVDEGEASDGDEGEAKDTRRLPPWPTPAFSKFLLEEATERGFLTHASRNDLEPVFISFELSEEEELESLLF